MATDAGLTSYHAMVARGGAKKGMRVGIIGLGGLGYIGARIAVFKGAEVYAAELNPETRARAAEIGLTGVAESITEFADKDLQLIVDYRITPEGIPEGLDRLRKGGVTSRLIALYED
ncbi:hypothetical protein FAIPA1_260075 [Frankia sp. AiPs1]|uniref:hypothetical protein n=1 Tax=Frankia sp. AiPa1 TaxID=573492 RepID=UPI00202B8277|nr:hypothetical protein [Frankia sp. AiPa1]MCL9762100.1 hypothetical protein [Frankia sp. AiPa1]